MKASPTNITGANPINTLDSEESTLEEDPEPVDDLCNIILDEREEDPEPVDDLHNVILDDRGEEQPCPAETAADPVMDPQAEAVTSTQAQMLLYSLKRRHSVSLPPLIQLRQPRGLGAQNVIILLREEEMTDFPQAQKKKMLA